MAILVTGSTGQLGGQVLKALAATGAMARGVTRHGGPNSTTADLLTADGAMMALRGHEAIVHCATVNGRQDVQMARNLVDAAAAQQVSHLVLISIVGIDQIPLSFYRQRVQIEEIVRGSGIPYSIQRATQFHSLIASIFHGQRFLPLVIAPRIQFQPISVPEVAGKLAELALGDPQGRTPDIGGPERQTLYQMHRTWKLIAGDKRMTVPLRIPGKLFAAYDAGASVVAGEPYGQETFAEYLERRYAGRH